MKKLQVKKYFLLVLFYFSLLNIQSQGNIKVHYKKTGNVSISGKDKTKATGVFLRGVYDNMIRIDYYLYANQAKSVFKREEKMDIELGRSKRATKFSKLLGGGEGTYFFDKTTNLLTHKKELDAKTYLIKYPEKIKWILTQEKKKIGKYICYKAITKSSFIGSSGKKIETSIIAWYTTDIPFSYGPLHYNGLPGLIIELSNDKVTFYAKEIILNPKEIKKIQKPSKGIEITKQEYDAILSEMANNKYKK